MKLNHTDAFKNFPLYLDVIYFSAITYLFKSSSIRINKYIIITKLIELSPTIIGNCNRSKIEYAIKDIYKQCYKNNHKNTKYVKLSKMNLLKYLCLHNINVGGLNWL
jgi:hypothetical protein